jgi:hypothetical protein
MSVAMLAIRGMIVPKPVKKLLSSTTVFSNNKEAITGGTTNSVHHSKEVI